jgi:RsiW-degrading membrane proteinase PrsW (M82 family)
MFSTPVVVFGVLFITSGVLLRSDIVLLLAAAALPSLVVLAFLLFLDRVEPEPVEGRWHALLWGGMVAGMLAGLINETVAFSAGELAAIVIAAPVGEELLKGAGLLWAVRRGEIDDVLDGAIYAGWIAVGFTVTEDLIYYVFAADDGILTEMILARSLGTFAHPLFTVWIGIAVGRAVAARTNVRTAMLRGAVPAIALHATWNLSTLLPIWAASFLAFVVLAGFTVRYLRRHEREFRHDVHGAAQIIADAAATSPLSPRALHTLERTTDVAKVRTLRRRLPLRARRALDAERAAIVRLLLRARRARIVYPAEILELGDHLAEIDRLATAARST